jgi:hypothetical protein
MSTRPCTTTQLLHSILRPRVRDRLPQHVPGASLRSCFSALMWSITKPGTNSRGLTRHRTWMQLLKAHQALELRPIRPLGVLWQVGRTGRYARQYSGQRIAAAIDRRRRRSTAEEVLTPVSIHATRAGSDQFSSLKLPALTVMSHRPAKGSAARISTYRPVRRSGGAAGQQRFNSRRPRGWRQQRAVP